MVFIRTLLILALCLAAPTAVAAVDTVTRIDDVKTLGEVTRINSTATVDVQVGVHLVRIPST